MSMKSIPGAPGCASATRGPAFHPHKLHASARHAHVPVISSGFKPRYSRPIASPLLAAVLIGLCVSVTMPDPAKG